MDTVQESLSALSVYIRQYVMLCYTERTVFAVLVFPGFSDNRENGIVCLLTINTGVCSYDSFCFVVAPLFLGGSAF